MNVVILAAGIGSRLGKSYPKVLTQLKNNQTILERQISHINRHTNEIMPFIVVGFKASLIMENYPQLLYIYNPKFAHTNTSKSLLLALENIKMKEGILWMNGDVVFEDTLLEFILPYIEKDRSFVCVNDSVTADEEVKYTLKNGSYIDHISKEVKDGKGEAIGINYISSKDKAIFSEYLGKCQPNDYFEKAIEQASQDNKIDFLALDISQFVCMEIDFQEDLNSINEQL